MTDAQIIDKLHGYIQVMDEIIRACPPEASGAKGEHIKTMAELIKVRVMISRPASSVAAPAPATGIGAPAPQGGQGQYNPPVSMAQAQAIIVSGCPKCGKPVAMRVSKKSGKPYISCTANVGQNKTCDFFNAIAG